MGEENTEELKALSLKTDKAFCTYFRSLEPSPTVVRFFDRKTFYSAHGKDAQLLADVYFKSRHALRTWDRTAGSMPLEYVAVRSGIEFQSVVRELLVVRKMRVEVYATKAQGSGWELVRRASPGDVEQFEDVLDGALGKEPPVAVAVSLGGGAAGARVGLAFAETSLLELGVMEFEDDEQLSNFECALLQLGAKECFVLDNTSTGAPDRRLKRAHTVLEKLGVPTTACKRVEFSRKDIEQDLGTLLGSVIHNLPELDQRYAMEALACIIKRLDLLQLAGSATHFHLRREDLARYVKLDYAAQRALNLVPGNSNSGSGNGNGSGNMSLYGLLDRCKTAMGSRRLLRWVKQPLVDIVEITQRLDFVELFVGATELRQTLREDYLRGFADLDRMARRLGSERASLQDCVVLYDNAEKLAPMARLLQEEEEGEENNNGAERPHAAQLAATYAAPIAKHAERLRKYQAMIEQLVDLSKAQDHVYEINTSWSDELAALDGKRNTLMERMERMALQAAADLAVKQVRLVDAPQWGWVFRITKADERRLRECKRYYALDKKGAGAAGGAAGIRFSCAELERLAEAHKACTAEYEELSRDIVRRVVEVARSYLPVFEAVSDCIADLDALLSLAHVSASRGYVRPAFSPLGTGNTVLRDCRHPCVEAAATVGSSSSSSGASVEGDLDVGEGTGSFIPNDIELVRGRSQFIIVTGPNMGGKSTYIRQAGVAVVMAQMGCFVPAREATVSIVDSVLCRVGAGDSQLRGVSTFMAEMLETAAILRTATPRSLIIIDELGRGTSTYDGFGLAWAISEHICNTVGCFCFFATHFHELTALQDKIPFVRNLHVTAQTLAGRLVLQYKVREGPCDQSFGIHVAVLADFPQAVIDVAKRKAAELEDFQQQQQQQQQHSMGEEEEEEEEEGSEPPAAKKSKCDNDEAEKVSEFLQQFAALPLDKMSDSDALKKAKEITYAFVKE